MGRKHTSVVTTVTPETPGVPHAVVLTPSSTKTPGGRAWVIHHCWEADAPSLPRVGCDDRLFGSAARTFRLARLGAAPAQGDALGYRDFGRPVAAWSSAGLNSPELLPARFPARTPLPSTASHPAPVTIANAPRSEAGRGEYNHRNKIRSSGARRKFCVVIPGRPPRQRRANPESLAPLIAPISGFRVRPQLRCARPGMTGVGFFTSPRSLRGEVAIRAQLEWRVRGRARRYDECSGAGRDTLPLIAAPTG